MLEESFREDENSKVVTGTVVNITPTEVFVDVDGRKQTGVIALDDLSAEPISNPSQAVSIGDKLSLVIMKLMTARAFLSFLRSLWMLFRDGKKSLRQRKTMKFLKVLYQQLLRAA